MFREPKAGDQYVLPSGSQIVVVKMARNETVLCHYLQTDGSKRRGKAAVLVLTPEFLVYRCSRKKQ